jgi:hypothetical protein
VKGARTKAETITRGTRKQESVFLGERGRPRERNMVLLFQIL